MSANLTPAAIVPAVVASTTPANPRAEDGPNAPAIPLAMTGLVPPSHGDDSISVAQAMTVLPAVDTITTILPTDNVAPKRKASQKPGYLDYDEHKLQETLNAMEDAVIWAEKHQEVYKTMVKWHKSFTKRGLELPPLLSDVIPCFVELEDDPAACHEQLVDFLREQRTTQLPGIVNTTEPTSMGQAPLPPSDLAPTVAFTSPAAAPPGNSVETPKEQVVGSVSGFGLASILHPAPTNSAVAPNVIPSTPSIVPVGSGMPMPNDPVAGNGPQPWGSTMGPAAIRTATPQPEAGPSRQRESTGPKIGKPGHRLAAKGVAMISTHISRPRQQPPRGSSDVKGKQKYRELSSDSEYEEEDQLESEEDTEPPIIKQEPLTDQPGFQAYAREVQIEMELEAEAEREGPRTRSSGTKGPRRKVKAEPKTPAVVPDTDEEEDTPMVVDRFAAAGENDPPCNNCVSRSVTCQYVVDEWVTQCKLCQRQKVGCSISATKVLALKNSGRKRPRAPRGTTTRAPVKREAKPPKVPRRTPAPRKSRNKRAGLGISARRGETAAPGEPDDDDLDPLQDLIERFERFEQRQKEMEKGMRQLSRDVREVKSAQISLAVGTNQQSVRIMEHHSLMVAEISRLLRGAGISTEINVPSNIYLGKTPNKSAMSLEDLAAQWPKLFDNAPNLNLGQLSHHEDELPIEGSHEGGMARDARAQRVISAVASGVGSNKADEIAMGDVLCPDPDNNSPGRKTGFESPPSLAAPAPRPQDAQTFPLDHLTSNNVPPDSAFPRRDPTTSLHNTPSPARAVPPETIAPSQVSAMNVGVTTVSSPGTVNEVCGNPAATAPGPEASESIPAATTGVVENTGPMAVHVAPALSPIMEQHEGEVESMDIDPPLAGSQQAAMISPAADMSLPVIPQSCPIHPKSMGNPPPAPLSSLPPPPEAQFYLPTTISTSPRIDQAGPPTGSPVTTQQPPPVTELPAPQAPPTLALQATPSPQILPLVIIGAPADRPADHAVMTGHMQASVRAENVPTAPHQGEPAGLTVPPATPARGTKRSRSSSVLSTRSSKRLRGETPV